MRKTLFLLLITFLCSACVKTYTTTGHLFEDGEIKALHNAKNKEEVESMLGSPSTISSFGKETWYYITSKKSSIAFLPSKVVEQTIVEITFNKNDTVDKVFWYSEKDAKKLALIEEYTVSKGTDSSKIQKFFRNAGRFTDSKKPEHPLPRSGF